MYIIKTIEKEQWVGLDSIDATPMAQTFQKSFMAAGGGVDAASFTGGRALQRESLDDVLQIVTLEEEHASLWRALPKIPIHSTIDQYNRLTAEGENEEWGIAINETEDPSDQVAQIARAFTAIKFYSDRRKVTDVSMMVDNATNPYTTQEKAGARNLIKNLNTHMYWGTPALSKRVEGLFSILTSSSYTVPTLDLQGGILSGNEDFDQLNARIANAGGTGTHAFMNPLLAADFNAVYKDAQRITITPGDVPGSGRMYYGAEVGGVETAMGRISFEKDRFNHIGGTRNHGLCPTVGTAGAPATPTITSATAAGTDGQQPTGNYYYRVTAISEAGESAPANSSVIAVTEGQHVALVLTPADAGTTGFRIYRSAVDAANNNDCRFLWEIPVSAPSSATTWNDNGSWVPGCAHIPVLDLLPQDTVLQWSQLFPLQKKDLAPLGWYEWFLIGLFGTLRVAKPEWCGLVKNVLPRYVRDQQGWDPLGKYPE